MIPATLLLRHARELLTMTGTLRPEAPWDPAPLGLIADGAVAVRDDRVVAVGPTRAVEAMISLSPDATVIDVGDAVLCPGLVDPHTHALFAGDRAHEFGMRVRGATYAEIAAQGGGIQSTMWAVRGASDADLVAQLDARLDRMRAYGTTTVEVKSGYGGDLAQELRCLSLLARRPESVIPTFLPLHAVPPERREIEGGRARFLREMREELLPGVIHGRYARFIDAYVDKTGFSVDETRPILEAALRGGLRPRLHIGQFADVGGAQLAAELGAASADHLEHVSDEGVRAMADAEVVGVLLPGAAFSLGQAMPDARRLRDLGLEVALGTDCNPGTSHTEALPLMAAFAVRQMGLSTVEAWHAITAVAARSLELGDRGALRIGARADLAVLDLASWEALPYAFGAPRARHTVVAGRVRSHLTA